jgi:hypothetical protein
MGSKVFMAQRLPPETADRYFANFSSMASCLSMR